jgi:hypothetical protein
MALRRVILQIRRRAKQSRSRLGESKKRCHVFSVVYGRSLHGGGRSHHHSYRALLSRSRENLTSIQAGVAAEQRRHPLADSGTADTTG